MRGNGNGSHSETANDIASMLEETRRAIVGELDDVIRTTLREVLDQVADLHARVERLEAALLKNSRRTIALERKLNATDDGA